MRRIDLSNKQLIQAFTQAKKLQLDEAFIHMLKKEIETRNLPIQSSSSDIRDNKDVLVPNQ